MNHTRKNRPLGTTGIRALRLTGYVGAALLWALLVWSLVAQHPPLFLQWRGVFQSLIPFELAQRETWWMLGLFSVLFVPLWRNLGLVMDARRLGDTRSMVLAMAGFTLLAMLVLILMVRPDLLVLSRH